jgi:hypothetical protein
MVCGEAMTYDAILEANDGAVWRNDGDALAAEAMVAVWMNDGDAMAAGATAAGFAY